MTEHIPVLPFLEAAGAGLRLLAGAIAACLLWPSPPRRRGR